MLFHFLAVSHVVYLDHAITERQSPCPEPPPVATCFNTSRASGLNHHRNEARRCREVPCFASCAATFCQTPPLSWRSSLPVLLRRCGRHQGVRVHDGQEHQRPSWGQHQGDGQSALEWWRWWWWPSVAAKGPGVSFHQGGQRMPLPPLKRRMTWTSCSSIKRFELT